MIKVKCPNCREKSDLLIDELPMFNELKCLNSKCGVVLKVQVAFVAPQLKPMKSRVSNLAA